MREQTLTGKIKRRGMQIKLSHDIMLQTAARGAETGPRSELFSFQSELPHHRLCYRLYFHLPLSVHQAGDWNLLHLLYGASREELP